MEYKHLYKKVHDELLATLHQNHNRIDGSKGKNIHSSYILSRRNVVITLESLHEMRDMSVHQLYICTHIIGSHYNPKDHVGSLIVQISYHMFDSKMTRQEYIKAVDGLIANRPELLRIEVADNEMYAVINPSQCGIVRSPKITEEWPYITYHIKSKLIVHPIKEFENVINMYKPS